MADIPVFDAARCQGRLFRGYSGCCCGYCRSYKQLAGRWKVAIKGAAGESSFEISVIRENNRHGKTSYGWFDEAKLLISHNGGPCRWSVGPSVWSKLVRVAHEVAEELNKQEAANG